MTGDRAAGYLVNSSSPIRSVSVSIEPDTVAWTGYGKAHQFHKVYELGLYTAISGPACDAKHVSEARQTDDSNEVIIGTVHRNLISSISL